MRYISCKSLPIDYSALLHGTAMFRLLWVMLTLFTASTRAVQCSKSWLRLQSFGARDNAGNLLASVLRQCEDVGLHVYLENQLQLRLAERTCCVASPSQSCDERMVQMSTCNRSLGSALIDVCRAATEFVCTCNNTVYSDDRELCAAVAGAMLPDFTIADHIPSNATRGWILTSSDEEATYAKVSRRMIQQYAAKHGYGYSIGTGHGFISKSRHPYWIKILMILRAINMPTVQQLGVEWIVWMDADTTISALDRSVESILADVGATQSHNLVLQEDPASHQAGVRWDETINCGIMLVRNHEWSFRFFATLFKTARNMHFDTGNGNYGDQSAIIHAFSHNDMNAQNAMRVVPLDGSPLACINGFIRPACIPAFRVTSWRPGCWTSHASGLSGKHCGGRLCRDCVAASIEESPASSFEDIMQRCFNWAGADLPC